MNLLMIKTRFDLLKALQILKIKEKERCPEIDRD